MSETNARRMGNVSGFQTYAMGSVIIELKSDPHMRGAKCEGSEEVRSTHEG